VLLSPEAINLDEANRSKLQAVANKEPLALIEYWAVDPDYDGKVFRSVWQDYRGNTENDGDPLRVVTQAVLICRRRTARAACACGRWMCSALRRKRWRRWRWRREICPFRLPAGEFRSRPCRGGVARF
jgi:hypothetical protein